jgi:hypothetical protein
MKQTRTPVLIVLAAMTAASCGGGTGDVAIKSIGSPLAQGVQPADVRVAEGNAQMALGNVGLALEAYRKALREAPNSVEALVGVATCYDRMGRFDLSRRHYEAALAAAPQDHELYAQLAHSLELQGRVDEAAQVKKELASRVVAPEAPRQAPGSVLVLPPPPAPSVTVALAPPRSAPVAVAHPAAPVAQASPVRLERLSMGEVALITKAEPVWQARTVARTAQSTTIRFEERKAAPVTLLNAARVRGLAARTRAYLTGRGFRGAAIGDAPAVRQRSAILYAPVDRARAERLAAQFGFALERKASARPGVILLLGRDAAREPALVARRA